MNDAAAAFAADEVMQEGQQPEDPATAASTSTKSKNSVVVDVTSLVGKLESLLSNNSSNNNGCSSTINSMPLVPQLASLRSQYVELGNDGFVKEVGVLVRTVV